MIKDIKNRYATKLGGSNSVKKSYSNSILDLNLNLGYNFSNSLQSDRLLLKAFSSTPDVYGVINYLSTAKSKIPVKMMDKNGEEIESHEIKDLINNPNYYQSKKELLKQLFAFEYVLGSSFLNAYAPAGFKPDRLFSLPPQNTQILTKSDPLTTDFRVNEIKAYKLLYSTIKASTIDANNVMHTNRINLIFEGDKYLRGLSPLVSSKMPINSLIKAYEAQLSIFESRGAMGVLTPKSAEMPFAEGQKEEILKEYYNTYGLGSDQAKILITPIATDYTQLGLPISELELNETNIANFESICTALNFNASLLKNTGASTRDNIMHFEKQLWTNNLVPELDDYYNNFTQFLKRFWKEEFTLVPDYSSIEALRKDDKTLAETRKIEISSGVKTPNEARVEAGLEPSKEKGMDDYYISKALVPVKEINNE